jgi:uncharacterized protein (TIGR00369 family)
MTPPDLRALLERIGAAAYGTVPPASLTSLQGEIIDYDPPAIISVQYPILPGQMNPFGGLQGGFLGAMMDNVLGLVTFSVDPPRPFSTMELSVRFFAPIRGQRVVIHGTLVRAGKTTSTCECTAHDESGALCAKGYATNFFLDPKRLSEPPKNT